MPCNKLGVRQRNIIETSRLPLSNYSLLRGFVFCFKMKKFPAGAKGEPTSIEKKCRVLFQRKKTMIFKLKTDIEVEERLVQMKKNSHVHCE